MRSAGAGVESKQPRGFVQELRRRHVVRTALGYAAAVFVVLQLAEIVLPAFQSPFQADATLRLLVVGAVLLFPVVLAVAWVYEITPLGIRSMEEVDAEEGVEPHGSLSHRAAFLGITVAAVLGAGTWWSRTAEAIPDPSAFRTASFFEVDRTTDAQAPIHSLAVLPLEDISAETGQEYFALGMHDILLSELSRLDFIRVLSRTSVMQYAPRGRSMSQIGDELNVDAVVEGQVLRSEGQVRITVRLYHAGSETQLWSETYERELADVIALQREVAEAVTTEIEMRLLERAAETGDPLRVAGSTLEGGIKSGEEAAPAGTDRTATDTARTASAGERVAAGETATGRTGGRETAPATEGGTGVQTVSGTPTAGVGAQATAPPAAPPAQPGASTQVVTHVDTEMVHPIPPTGWRWDEDIPLEMQEAFMRGRVALFQEPRSGGAEEYFRRILEVDSSFAPALAGLAGALVLRRSADGGIDTLQMEAARDAASRAVALDPDNPEAVEVLRSVNEALASIRGGVGEIRIVAPETQLGQLLQGQVAQMEVREAPSDEQARVRAVLRMVAAGRLMEAGVRGMELVEQGVDDLALWEGLEQVFRIQGDVEDLLALRQERRDVRGREPGPSLRDLVRGLEEEEALGYWRWKRQEVEARSREGSPLFWAPLATARLALGDRDGALDALQRAVRDREPLLSTLRFDPVWDTVRADPRFQSLLREMRPEGSRRPGGEGGPGGDGGPGR